MVEAGYEAGYADFTYYLSESEVNEAHHLASRGRQRLRNISETERTIFFFVASCDDHFAFVVVEVSPVTPEGSHYASYDVFANYEPCCNAAQADQIEREIQLMYDTTMQAVRRTFDEGCCRRRAVRADPPTSCQQWKQGCLKWLERKRGFEAERWDDTSSCDSEDGSEDPASPALSQTLPSRPSTRRNKRQRHDVIDPENSPADVDTDLERGDSRKRPKYIPKSNEKFAEILIDQAKKGMKALEEERTASDPLVDEAIFSQLQQLAIDPESINMVLSMLEEKFGKLEKNERDRAKPKVWVYWYYAACFHFTLYRRGERTKDRRTAGVGLLHRILNRLLALIGIKALALIAAYAEQGFRLSEPSRASEANQEHIVDMAVTGLCDQLQALEEQYIIHFPAVLVGIATKMSPRDACHTLEIPNLSILLLEPVRLSDQGKISKLSQVLRYSLAVEKWTAFAQIEPQLRLKLQECQASWWAQLSDEQRFSWVVKEYCDFVELQLDGAEPGGSLPMHADGGTTANTNRPLDPSQGRNANPAATDTIWDDDWLDYEWSFILDSIPNYFNGPLSIGQSHLMGFNSTTQDH